jgi:maltose/moltooligosaccharide transporter
VCPAKGLTPFEETAMSSPTNPVSLSGEKPRLSFWQIWNMSFGFLGIQFGFALQNANTSRIFESLGAEKGELAILWLAAPVTGLLVQPIIGYYSDRTWHPKWGRRRPFFAIGALLASIALVFMPNSPVLWMAVGMLWIMDASINVSMEPFRAFVGDMLPPAQRTTGFAMQSFFIGIGAVVASALPWIFTNWIGISNEPTADSPIPDSVRWSFYVGAVVFFAAVMWTVLSTKEYPPDEADMGEKKEEEPLIIRYSPAYYRNTGLILLAFSALITSLIYFRQMDWKLYVMCGVFALFGFAYTIASLYMSRNIYRIGFVQMVRDFQNMPKPMIQLAFVQFFSWFALFSMWIYSTSAVTSHIYQADDPQSKLYNDGADWVTVLFSAYNGFAALVAFLIPVVARKTSRKFTHMLCLFLGGLGLISFYFITNPNLLLVSMVGVGIAWASILSVPYAMLSSSLPAKKMGYYMGIFNFFIVIPQIIAASTLGYILETFFANQTIYALLVGGASMILAGLLNLLVNDKEEVLLKERTV